jgi:hypothetical protein
MKKSSQRAGHRRNRLAAEAAAIVASVLLLPAVALAHAGTMKSCAPSNHAFALSLYAKGVPCSEAREIERHAAAHGWRSPFRLSGRRWNPTIYRRLHLHTQVRFQSGQLIVWIEAAKPSPTGGLSLGSGCCTTTPAPGYFAGNSSVIQADGSSIAIADEEVGNRVRSYQGAQERISGTTSTTLDSSSMMFIQLDDGSRLIASPNATIWIPDGPRLAESLQPGDEVDTISVPSVIATISMGRYSGEADQLEVEGPNGNFIANGTIISWPQPWSVGQSARS